MSIKAISIKQPWASLIAWGYKTIEWRSWATNYRGPLLIHASGHKYIADDGNDSVELPTGAIIAQVDLIDVRPFLPTDVESAILSEFFHCESVRGMAWVLANPRQVEPVRHKGRLRLWEFGGEVRALQRGRCHVEELAAMRSAMN